jgi:hypothetical protein
MLPDENRLQDRPTLPCGGFCFKVEGFVRPGVFSVLGNLGDLTASAVPNIQPLSSKSI